MLGRLVFAGCGWIAVGCAVAGMILPGVPTTIFVLAAAYCFARSSPRLSAWLRTHRWFGPILERCTRQGMPRAAKVSAIATMWAAVAVSSGILAQRSVTAASVTIGAGVVGTLAIVFGVRTAPDAGDDSGPVGR